MAKTVKRNKGSATGKTATRSGIAKSGPVGGKDGAPATAYRSPAASLVVRQVEVSDITGSLKAGLGDFFRRPLLSGFFGLVYALFGIFIVAGLVWFDRIWMVMPAAIGFPLVAPFAAAGLYDISRRLQKGQAFSASDVFLVIKRQRNRELGWMAFVTLFIFWIWIYQVRLLTVIILQSQSISSIDGFIQAVTTTSNGAILIAVGSVVGAFLATVLFSVTVISMPLLLDREIDFVSAMVLSIKTVATSPVVMIGWGWIIAVLMILAMIPAFLGLLFVLPVLGHATWHLYQRAIRPVDAGPPVRG